MLKNNNLCVVSLVLFKENRLKMCNSMIQQNFVASILAVGVFMLVLSQSSYANIAVDSDKNVATYSNKVTKSEASERLSQLNSVIEITVTDEVQERIQQYTYAYRSSAEKLLGRSNVFFPMFEQEIMRRGMPDDLKYLAIIESMLNPNATSRSGAAGLWQFMKGTGKMVGLEVNSVVDQRRSVELSTQGALDYLQSLYDRFGDWNLAIAAYNCGPGNVSKAIRKSGSKDFWKLRKYLPRETQKYLPRFIAAMYLTNFYQHHGLKPNDVDTDLTNVVTVSANQSVRFSKLATELGLESDEILKQLNPEYLSGYVPGKSQYTIRIPSRTSDKYFKKYEPGTYSKIMEERAELQRMRVLELKKQKEAELLSMKRDSVTTLQSIVSLILSPLQSREVVKPYRIPTRMRSRQSYLKA